MKVVFKIILLLGVLSYLVFAITTLSQHSEERVCVGSEVIINGKVDKDYITPRFIENIIAATEIPIKGALVNNIDVRHIESSILSSPYVDSVTCYYTSGNLLCVKVVPRIPILHAVPNQGESFYMDANGKAPDSIEYNGAHISYYDLLYNFAKITQNHTDAKQLHQYCPPPE